jgi:hypothetical protein
MDINDLIIALKNKDDNYLDKIFSFKKFPIRAINTLVYTKFFLDKDFNLIDIDCDKSYHYYNYIIGYLLIYHDYYQIKRNPITLEKGLDYLILANNKYSNYELGLYYIEEIGDKYEAIKYFKKSANDEYEYAYLKLAELIDYFPEKIKYYKKYYIYSGMIYDQLKPHANKIIECILNLEEENNKLKNELIKHEYLEKINIFEKKFLN